MNPTQRHILTTTSTLLETQGLHATGLNQIIQASGAPKGSLYYYYPGGKDELAEAAINAAGELIAERIQAELSAHADAAVAVRRFVEAIAEQVERSEFQRGGPLMTVAMETASTNQRLNNACRSAYSRIHSAFAARLLADGWDSARAAMLATMITAAIEGGVILSRTHHSAEPLQVVAKQLAELIQLSAAPPHG
ncbi:MAG: TetR/AcrR family transcriptional regulator [Herpetosiphonaceae bacterium]|nr:TetR/AcrR family transcriptional regulator [Herpetosiphonaceae bacterium]